MSESHLTSRSQSTGSPDFHPGLALAFARAVGKQNTLPDFSDVTVEVEDAVFPSHRFILSAHSGFFRALFTSGMREDKERYVRLERVSKEIFALVLECIFESKNVVNHENLIDLWHAADLLEILPLKDLCEEFIAANIDVTNCAEIYLNAKLLSVDTVARLAWDFVLDHFDKVRKTKAILDFELADLKCLIKDSRKRTQSGDHVTELVLDWAYCPTSELAHLDDHNGGVSLRESNDPNQGVSHVQSGVWDNDARGAEVTSTSGPPSSAQTVESNKNLSVDIHVQNDKRSDIRLSYQRVEFLPDLLRRCRVRFILSKCLLCSLNDSCSLAEVDEAKALLMKCVQSRGKKEHVSDNYSTCLLHRAHDELEDVVVWFEQLENDSASSNRRRESGSLNFGYAATPSSGTSSSTDVAVVTCMRKDTRSFKLKTANFVPLASAVCDNQLVVVGHASGVTSLYTLSLLIPSSDSQFVPIPFSKTVVVGPDIAMVNVEGQLYLTGGQVESREVVYAGSTRLNMVSLTDPLVSVSKPTLAVAGSKIIVFGGDSSRPDVTVVQCIDTRSGERYRVGEVDGLYERMATFQNVDDSYFLFRSGALWKVEENPETGRLRTRFVTVMWHFDRAVCGAKLVDEELWLFCEERNHGPTATWPITVEGALTLVRNIQAKGFHFQHASMPMSVCNAMLS